MTSLPAILDDHKSADREEMNGGRGADLETDGYVQSFGSASTYDQ